MKYIPLILFILLISSCGKKNQIKVTAKNAATEEGFSGLYFRLMEVKPYTTSTGEVHKKVYEGTLNAQGEAVFEYKMKDRSYVITTAVPEEELCYINSTQYFLHRDDNLTFDFRFAECAYLKIKIENVNCEGENDNFKLYFEGRQVEGNEFQNGSLMSEHEGCVSLESDNFISHPMGYRYYRWEVTRNGNTEEFSDTIYLDKGEYKTYEINY